MGEAKEKSKVAHLILDLTASQRERGSLYAVLGNVQPKGRYEQRQYTQLFDQLDLNQFDDNPNMKLTDLSTEQAQATMTVEIANYMLDQVDKQAVPGLFVRALMPLVERVIQAKDQVGKEPEKAAS